MGESSVRRRSKLNPGERSDKGACGTTFLRVAVSPSEGFLSGLAGGSLVKDWLSSNHAGLS
jgi:hypothetical protein